MKRQIINLIPVIVIAAFLGACSKPGKDKPGSIYMPDMTYSNAYETYSASYDQNAPEKTSARKPVERTIPYGYIPDDPKVKTNQGFLMSYMIKNHYTHDPAKLDEERIRAANEIQNPFENTSENLEEGKRLYNINCSPCHGEKGDGNGQLVELPGGGDGPFTSRPQSYKALLPTLKDGAIFYSVSYGKNMMGGYGFQLSVKERWQVIHYIKKLGGIPEGKGAAATEPKK